MQPFRTSPTARGFSAAAAFALLGAGLIPVLGLSPAWLSLAILGSLGIAFASLMAGVSDHTPEVMLLVALSPVAFFTYVCGALLVVEALPSYGWVLIALSGIPIGLFIASVGTHEPSREVQPEVATHTT